MEGLLTELERKIKRTIDVGAHRGRPEDVFRLDREVPCSVTTVEQAHASGAILLRDTAFAFVWRSLTCANS